MTEIAKLERGDAYLMAAAATLYSVRPNARECSSRLENA